MKPKPDYFDLQYNLVRQSRKVLFDYCRSLGETDLLTENNFFGRGGSIRNLLVHIANTYEFWIVKHYLNENVVFTTYESKNSVDEIEELFKGIDLAVFQFIRASEKARFEKIAIEIDSAVRKLTPFELFTHVITHEFHHKGQVLSMSRHLGHIPVDTDVIR